ncbi:DUF1259 domain-containing protein [Metabacillus sediminilitoris]|uniref:DUF1259 domain-containing protein n=1 Tax=Metabacillus sediminilitoris TaxID=2567941 RepID=A0A4S4BX54_9BACI|nr:DUF1259 domain-containing protein [Metabacillus sediminilitoris]QGQ46067.1 DUF1259 domain-containing protein [Metabacillus sediminilitoris]THF79751.1 DUF1259 domain-containing protein [Metabacillus sediminilitoris]
MGNNDESICQKFPRIIGGQMGFAGGKCVATINRDELHVTILKKRFRVTTSFSFDSRDAKTGQALCLGRVVLLQTEVDDFVAAILKQVHLLLAYYLLSRFSYFAKISSGSLPFSHLYL